MNAAEDVTDKSVIDRKHVAVQLEKILKSIFQKLLLYDNLSYFYGFLVTTIL